MFTSTTRCGTIEKIGVLAVAAVLLMLRPAAAVTVPRKDVSLYLSVEEKGGLVQGLTARNFRLYQDGKAEPFALEKPQTPVTIALLLEYSENSWMYYDDIDEAISGFLNDAPKGNWYALASFAHSLHIDADFTQNIGKLQTAFQEMPQPMWSEVNTDDAVYQMLDKMSLLHGRRVLIVVGSGFDTFSRHTFEDVQKKVESSNVTIFGVGLGSMLRGVDQPYLSNTQQMDVLLAENFLRMLSRESGGESWFPDEEGAYPEVMEGIMQTLANQYRLVYSPDVTKNGKLHKIEVQAFQEVNDSRKDFKVRVRKGFRFY